MRRTIAFILLACIFIVALSGCGNNTVGTETAGPKIDTQFKETMDAYEEFFDEYIAFMKKFQANPTDLSLLSEYTTFMSEYTSMMSKMSALGEEKMNEAEAEYYLEVTNRINKKLLDIVS